MLEMAPITSSDEAGPSSYDYTEGASVIDIGNALDNNRRARRDSQYSTYYNADGDGAMFSGSGHSVNSSSDSKMGEEAVITGHNLGKRALIAHATNEGIVGVVKYLVRQSIWINTSQTRHSVDANERNSVDRRPR